MYSLLTVCKCVCKYRHDDEDEDEDLSTRNGDVFLPSKQETKHNFYHVK